MHKGMNTTVIIPAYNEEALLGRVLEAMPGGVETVIVVDDGSKDRTAEIARATGAVVVSHGTNRGVGKAFASGLEVALRSGADLIVNIDADGQFDPARIPDLIAPIIEGRADMTTASRFKDPALYPDMPRVKFYGNLLMSRLISQIAGRRFYDVSCGFRAYSRKAALHLNLWGQFTYTQESILDLVIKGMRIEEVPMRIEGVRQIGQSRVASNLWRYGSRALQIILHTYRDFWPMHFFGWLSLPFLVSGTGLGIFLLIHRISHGAFSPHIWAGFTGGSLFALGVVLLIAGLTGEMLKRIRLNQELMLYYHRRSDLETSEPLRTQPPADGD